MYRISDKPNLPTLKNQLANSALRTADEILGRIHEDNVEQAKNPVNAEISDLIEPIADSVLNAQVAVRIAMVTADEQFSKIVERISGNQEGNVVMDALKAFELAMKIPKKSYEDARNEHIETLSHIIYSLNNVFASLSNDNDINAEVKQSMLEMLTTFRNVIAKTLVRFEEIF